METTPNTTPNATSRQRPLRHKLLVGAAVVGAMLGTAGVAVAQTSATPTTDPAATQSAPAPDSAPADRSQAVHPGEELLTGDVASKVADAARGAVADGTVDRVETDAEGSPYEAHVTKADGSHVTVKVSDDFSVTGVETERAGGPGGHQGPPPNGQAPTGAPAGAPGVPTA